MGSSSLQSSAGPADFLGAFRSAAGPEGRLRFDGFMDLALFHPIVGYYSRDRRRVGYGPGTDFFTATTSGGVFADLVIAACRSLRPGGDPARWTFVEIGAEPGQGLLEGRAHPFGATRTIRLGQPLELSGDCIVFSNELFDAQPCRRFVRSGGGWRETFVDLQDENLVEVDLPAVNVPVALPDDAPEGYRVDAPLAAATLLRGIAMQPWHGLFLACDYGKSWAELAEATPAGTVRAYHAHTQGNDLLAQPGEQDLTCHVCWDWLVDGLAAAGFREPAVASHESFFVRQAGTYIEATIAAEAGGFSPRKQALMQLLHPAHLGQKFQVLHALRPPAEIA